MAKLYYLRSIADHQNDNNKEHWLMQFIILCVLCVRFPSYVLLVGFYGIWYVKLTKRVYVMIQVSFYIFAANERDSWWAFHSDLGGQLARRVLGCIYIIVGQKKKFHLSYTALIDGAICIHNNFNCLIRRCLRRRNILKCVSWGVVYFVDWALWKTKNVISISEFLDADLKWTKFFFVSFKHSSNYCVFFFFNMSHYCTILTYTRYELGDSINWIF